MPTREDAWKLLCEYTQSESLRKHMLAVEACVRAYARKHGADQELWGVAALLHDFDYERWPNEAHAPDKEHPAEGAKILREQGYSEEIVRAILSHADYCNVPRHSPLEHTLFACDELPGFLTACAYVRPPKSILELEVESVKRRMKDKAFAKGVSREDVRKGAEELGIPLEEHIAFCIAALREHADALGLRGTIAVAVGGQVSEFMRYPVSEGVIAQIAVAVDKHASAGQVREHSAGISGGHLEAKCSSCVNILPVRHKENSQRINVGLHDPN